MLKANNICTIHTYLSNFSEIGKTNVNRTLIQAQSFDTLGRLIVESFYENGEETLKQQFAYYDTDEVRTLIVAQSQDTTSHQYENGDYPEIITGGLSDYFPTLSYFPNGLIKSETALVNDEEKLLTYEYVFKRP